MRRLAVAALLLMACAAAPRRTAPPGPPAESADVEQLYAELRIRDNDLHGVSVNAAASDCPRIRELRKNICTLAERICRIAEKEPERAAEYCEDGKARCRRATERESKQSCGEVQLH